MHDDRKTGPRPPQQTTIPCPTTFMFSNHGKESLTDIPQSDQRWIKLPEDYKPTTSFQVAIKFILGQQQKKRNMIVTQPTLLFSGDSKKIFENIFKKNKNIWTSIFSNLLS